MSVKPVKSKPYIIGLTGGIASGKSTVTKYLKLLHIPVIDSDFIVKNLWENKKTMIDEAEKAFGFRITSDEDKKKLSTIIFNDPEKRKILNEIVHPYVFEEIEKQKQIMDRFPYVVIDMPLLIEANYMKFCDHIVLVYVDQETQIKRLMERDQLTKDEAIQKINSQMRIEDKKIYAHTILDNRKDISDLYEAIDHFIEGLKHEKQQSIPTT
jgi:dephospho-CoA kinase